MCNRKENPDPDMSCHVDASENSLAMVLEEIIINRRSSRRFSGEPVSRQDIEDILKAGVYAPSGSNAQNQRFLVITDPEEISEMGRKRFVWPYPVKDRDRLKRRFPSGILGFAPVLIFVFVDAAYTDPFNHGEYHIWQILEQQNAGAAIQNMLLMATAKKLASCWVSATENMSYTRLLSNRSWRDLLGKYEISDTCRIQGCILLGKPKRTNEKGYAAGERKHGVLYKSTERKPLQHYMIMKKPARREGPCQAGIIKLSLLRILRKSMLFLASVIRSVDKLIYRLEQK